MEIKYHPVGIIHSPHKKLEGMPIQSGGCNEIEGEIEIFPEYRECLKDIGGFSHIYVLYHFHKSSGWKSEVIPFLDNQPRGLFSTRAPRRPNPIGLSVMEVLTVFENKVRVKNVDVLDGTPILDIKPYVPQFENVANPKIGWLANKAQNAPSTHADDRFIDEKGQQ